MIAMGWKRAQGFLGGKGRVLKLDFSDGCATVKNIELYTLNRYIVRYVSYISIKLFGEKKTTQKPVLTDPNSATCGQL